VSHRFLDVQREDSTHFAAKLPDRTGDIGGDRVRPVEQPAPPVSQGQHSFFRTDRDRANPPARLDTLAVQLTKVTAWTPANPSHTIQGTGRTTLQP